MTGIADTRRSTDSLGVIVPAFNEAAVIDACYRALPPALQAIGGFAALVNSA